MRMLHKKLHHVAKFFKHEKIRYAAWQVLFIAGLIRNHTGCFSLPDIWQELSDPGKPEAVTILHVFANDFPA